MTKRTGASLLVSPMTCPAATAMTLGFTEAQAERMLHTRRVLPVLEARTVPGLDARKLWERIGKPHGRFRDWAEHYIKPLIPSAEISALAVQGNRGGKAQAVYLLSRDVAAHLAMQANTEEGHSVRAYFLDMEELALKLAEHAPIRAKHLTEAGNELAHLCRKAAEDQAKAGTIPKAAAASVGHEQERDYFRALATILTGHSTSEWRATFGKGIRDVLDTKDLDTYAKALDSVVTLLRAGLSHEATTKALEGAYTGRIKAGKYARSSRWKAVAAAPLVPSATCVIYSDDDEPF